MASTTSTTTTGRGGAATGGGADEHGNPMSGGRDAVAGYDLAIDRFLRFHPDVVAQATTLLEEHPDAPMSHVLMAYLHLMSTDARDLATASEAHDALAALGGNEREQLHGAAIRSWLAGDWVGAARRLDDVLLRWPADLLALMLGHQLDFFLGDAQNLRDRPTRSVRQLAAGHPHQGFVEGMRSFGLEESGHYQHAEAAGMAALDVNADDVWAIHAVVHACEMQGRVDDGIRFMTEREADWGSGNLFTVHNWWHLALYCLEAGDRQRALAIYDAEVHHADSAGVPIEMLDASALLWRFELDGADTGGRFGPLAASWAAWSATEPWYVFNDLHATMAFAGAGRLDDAAAVVRRLDAYLDTASGTNARMTAEIGLPACRAVIAFVQGRHADVVAELAPIRRVLHHFGGSHAQRDALQRTLLESALRLGSHDLALALTAERLGVREASTYSWAQRARVLRSIGSASAAEDADHLAAAHRARFAAAL